MIRFAICRDYRRNIEDCPMGDMWDKLGAKRENMGLLWGKLGQIGANWGIADYQQVARWLPKGYRMVTERLLIWT